VTGVYAVKVASNATGTNLAATLKLDVTSSAEPVALSSMIDVAAIFTVSYAAGTGGTVANHPMQSGAVGNAVTVKRGTKIRFTNNDTARHITHGQGFFPHEDQTNGGAAGGTYELNTIAAAPGQTGQLGCHETNHGGAAGYITFTME
jgi:plastocyanin